MRQAIRMFDSLLDISRAEADQGTGGGLVPVDLSAVAAEVWDLYDALAEDKGLLCGGESHARPARAGRPQPDRADAVEPPGQRDQVLRRRATL